VQAAAQGGIDHGRHPAVDGQRGSVAGHDGLLLGRHSLPVEAELVRVVVAELRDLIHGEAKKSTTG
jgi:hypothetical protein